MAITAKIDGWHWRFKVSNAIRPMYNFVLGVFSFGAIAIVTCLNEYPVRSNTRPTQHEKPAIPVHAWLFSVTDPY